MSEKEGKKQVAGTKKAEMFTNCSQYDVDKSMTACVFNNISIKKHMPGEKQST